MGKIIEKDKPLPEHTRLRYEECYAKLLLERLFPEFDSNLQIEDKPDLYDARRDIGIEVTDCIDERTKEAIKLWYTMPYVSEEKQRQNKERMKQLGVEYQGGVQSWPSVTYNNDIDSRAFAPLYKSVRIKLQKINKAGLYKQCKEYRLFVDSELCVEEAWREKLATRLKMISSEHESEFSKIYLLTIRGLLCIDMHNLNVEAFDIKDQFDLACRARELVEKGEES